MMLSHFAFLALLNLGSDDNSVRLWEIITGRCMRLWKLENPINSLSWNPNSEYSVLAIAR